MKCPHCQAEATKFRKFWMCEVHGQLPEPKPFAPLRIFLSYGHDSNAELVLRIHEDLKKRGHDVWIDQNEIKSGHQWRDSITRGIVESHRVLAFLSKHSTRDPGVCLDEIAIAIGAKGGNIQTILVEGEKEVKPPPSISYIQWLDMRDWKAKRDECEPAWEKWYQDKLAEIVIVVESEESRRFAGEITDLEGYLKPISSHARIGQLLKKPLVGRAWLREAIETWRNAADRSSRLFWIMGVPGWGKSAFVADLVHNGRDKVIAVEFCQYNNSDHRNAHYIVCTLAFQIATRLPDYRKLLLTLPEINDLDGKNPDALFDYLLANPLKLSITGGRERYLIVIDALDEAGEARRNPLVEMLARNAQRLPDWLGLVVTSRPEFDVKTPLQALNPFPLDTHSESNRADIRDYLRGELASPLQNRPDADRLVEQILEKSEDVFLYVEHFCDDLRHGNLSLDRPEQFPQGLGGIYCQWFQRQFPDETQFERTFEPMIGVILAAREPLPVEMLQKVFGWRETELRKWLRKLGSLFPVTKEANSEVITPYRKSLADWMVDEAKAGTYFVSECEGHKRLASFGFTEYRRDVTGMSAYSVRYVLLHLRRSQEDQTAELLARDPKFIKVRHQLGLQRVFILHARDCQGLPGRITEDLRSRGHELVSAIDSTDTVLLFMSPKTFGEGYCRNELVQAMGLGRIVLPILVESEREVRPPVSISHIQWLDMHDWKKHHAAGEKKWEQWYNAKFAEIIRVVGSEESRPFTGEIETLKRYLRPLSSAWRITGLLSKDFCGRQWLFEAVEKWRLDTKRDSRVFWILGAPGVGKSAFAAQLTQIRSDAIIAAQFAEWDKPDHSDPRRIVLSLAFQLATRLPDYRKLLLTLPEMAELDRMGAAELFDCLLANPLRSVSGGRERYLIVIDALDEAGNAGRNPLAEILARFAPRLPEWIGFVVTSRPERDVCAALQGLNPFVFDTNSEFNRADLRDYLLHELAPQLKDRPNADRLVEQILEKSEGVFFYVQRFCDDVHQGHLSVDSTEPFPPGFGAFLWTMCMHQFPDLDSFRRDVRPVLRVILGAKVSLPIADLQRVLNWSEREVFQATNMLGSLFPITSQHGQDVIKPFHTALASWLSDEAKAGPYFVEKSEGERLLAERLPHR